MVLEVYFECVDWQHLDISFTTAKEKEFYMSGIKGVFPVCFDWQVYLWGGKRTLCEWG